MSLGIDFGGVKTSSFDVIPSGTYTVRVDSAEVKETKTGGGKYINVKFVIMGSDQHGRNLFHMFNFINNNPKAVEIGLQQLKSMMKCAGSEKDTLENVSDLLGLTCDAVVKVKTDDFGEKAVINYFKNMTPKGNAEVMNSQNTVPF